MIMICGCRTCNRWRFKVSVRSCSEHTKMILMYVWGTFKYGFFKTSESLSS